MSLACLLVPALFLASSSIPLAHAAGTLFISPASQGPFSLGTMITYQINVTGMDPLDSWDVSVKANQSVLNPVSISVVGNMLGSVFQVANCINGVGTGCSITDGAGVAHSSAASGAGIAVGGNGLLFTITYQVAGGGFSYLTIPPGLDILANSGNTVSHATGEGVYGLAPIVSKPAFLNIPVGAFGNSTITLNSINGFVGRVNVTAVVSPIVSNGVSASLTNSTPFTGPKVSVILLAGGAIDVSLNVTTTTATALQTFTINVTEASGILQRSFFVPVNVVDFSITASTTSLSFVPGSFGTSTIGLNSLNGFDGNVTLGVAVSPVAANGPVATLTNSSFTGTSVMITLVGGGNAGTATLSVTTTASTPLQAYTVNVTAISGPLQHFLLLSVNTVDFSITASNSSLSFAAGSSGVSSVTVGSVFGFAGNVTITASVSPFVANGPSISLTNSTFTGTSVIVRVVAGGVTSATLNVATTTSTPADVYLVILTGTNGSLRHSLLVSVSMISSFALTSTPVVPSSFIAGGSATSTITLTSLGLTGSLALVASISPAGANSPSVFLSNSSSTATVVIVKLISGSVGSAVLRIGSTTSTSPGTYTITVTANSGAASQNFVATITVSAVPTISDITLSPLGTTTAGHAVTGTVTVSNTGSVDASFNITVKWGTTTIAQMSETLPKGQQKSYSFSWDTTSSNPATDVVTATISSGNAWSSNKIGGVYSLSSTAPSGNLNTAIIGGLIAVVIVLSLLLILRRRKGPSPV